MFTSRKVIPLVTATALIALGGIGVVLLSQQHYDSLSAIEVTWPEEGAVLGNAAYIFEAQLSNSPLSSYDMYWALQDGALHKMNDSFAEVPHKYDEVDITTWPSQNNKAYTVQFIATVKDHPDQILESYTVTVSTAETAQTANTTAALVTAIPHSSSLSGLQGEDVTITWVTEGTQDAYDQYFTLALSHHLPQDYYAFWQVGTGSYTRMRSSNNEPFVSTHINFDSWHWRGNGPYDVHFIVQDKDAREVFRETFLISRFEKNGIDYVATSASHIQSETPLTEEPGNEPANTGTDNEETAPEAVYHSFVLDGKVLALLDTQAAAVRDAVTDDTARFLLNFIANQPQAAWLTGSPTDTQTIQNAFASADTDAIPAFVLYSIPHRDCGSYSEGGLDSYAEYYNWVNLITEYVAAREALFIIEPDALTLSSCLSETEQEKRFDAIAYAVKTLKAAGPVRTYIDIGHPYWLSVSDAADLLERAGIDIADGFALNTANYIETNENIAYGTNIINRLARDNKTFVIDTSRNGNGPADDNAWCNPEGRALGTPPQLLPTTNVDALLWVKRPGESDGTCNGGPRSGEWWLPHAFELIIERMRIDIQSL